MTQTAYREARSSAQKKNTIPWTYELLDPGTKAEFIFRHHFQHLTFLAQRMVFSETDAEDIVMNVIYKVVTSPRQPETPDHLNRKLYVSVRNEAIDYLRYRTQHRKALSQLSRLHPGQLHPGLHQNHLDKEKLLLLLFRQIRQLSPQRRRILLLYFFANKKTHEISAELSLSPQTILNHKARALQSLRNSDLKDFWRYFIES